MLQCNVSGLTPSAHRGRLREREGRGERRGRIRGAGVRRRRVCWPEMKVGKGRRVFNLWPGPESGVLV
ncbi:hypothetical protein EYF80_036772 [Liparis tanakae]|uniref:Uncharacterized protein n=1 Tax=Liparis tanakae TaxID=230148 RepID=A0A4Z2GII7_9TELE|nr:hypothetical protein EYF80_036772 [Liparis tanakae]